MTCLIEGDIETAKSEAIAVAGGFTVASENEAHGSFM
jgi:hypothetical protein